MLLMSLFLPNLSSSTSRARRAATWPVPLLSSAARVPDPKAMSGWQSSGVLSCFLLDRGQIAASCLCLEMCPGFVRANGSALGPPKPAGFLCNWPQLRNSLSVMREIGYIKLAFEPDMGGSGFGVFPPEPHAFITSVNHDCHSLTARKRSQPVLAV